MDMLRGFSAVRRIVVLVGGLLSIGSLGAMALWWKLGTLQAPGTVPASAPDDGLAGMRLGIAVFVLLCWAVGLAGAWAVARSIKIPVEDTIGAITRIAGGDLETRIESPGRDELAWMRSELNRMRKKLREMVIDMHQTASSVDLASEEIASGNADLSRRTEEQASALQQTSSSMQQIAAKVRSNHAQADEVEHLVRDTSSVASRGGSLMGEVVNRMSEIQVSASRIGEIIGVIDSIAFQTNILALNAAVEAARAGEHGRGFAVVASEVRTLAGRCAEAAREIKTLINASSERVDAGSRLVSDAGRTMTDIVAGIDRVAQVLVQIVAAGRSQASDIDEVHSAISRIDDVTQQNAALVEQVAAASTSLRNQASRLNSAVNSFQVQVH
ncbi:MAG: methyl-accepting chemotaxis protein [Pseudomonadota bacterium]